MAQSAQVIHLPMHEPHRGLRASLERTRALMDARVEMALRAHPAGGGLVAIADQDPERHGDQA